MRGLGHLRLHVFHCWCLRLCLLSFVRNGGPRQRSPAHVHILHAQEQGTLDVQGCRGRIVMVAVVGMGHKKGITRHWAAYWKSKRFGCSFLQREAGAAVEVRGSVAWVQRVSGMA